MIEEKIQKVFDKIQPFIMQDGGIIHFVAYKNNIVYVKLGGNCISCDLIDVTLQDGLLKTLKKEIPEVKDIKILLDSY